MIGQHVENHFWSNALGAPTLRQNHVILLGFLFKSLIIVQDVARPSIFLEMLSP
jgi:hypothetical protein